MFLTLSAAIMASMVLPVYAKVPVTYPNIASGLYHIEPFSSEIRFFVAKTGACSFIGHNVLVVDRNCSGFIRVSIDDNNTFGLSGSISGNCKDLLINDQVALNQEKDGEFKPLPNYTASMVMDNMLGEHVLDASNFPSAHCKLIDIVNIDDKLFLHCIATLHGYSRIVDIPITSIDIKEAELEIIGETSFKQTDFGIHPFSCFFNTLAIEDTIRVKFKIIARNRIRSH